MLVEQISLPKMAFMNMGMRYNVVSIRQRIDSLGNRICVIWESPGPIPEYLLQSSTVLELTPGTFMRY